VCMRVWMYGDVVFVFTVVHGLWCGVTAVALYVYVYLCMCVCVCACVPVFVYVLCGFGCVCACVQCVHGCTCVVSV